MDTLTHPVFTDEVSEFTAIQSSPSPIDFTDWPLSPNVLCLIGDLCPSLQITSPISNAGYFELEFHLDNNFWGCNFNFGNAACGVHIRQAFAHGLDKNLFISVELQGNAVPIDNPVPPPSIDLNTPDPCAWDILHPQTGSACQVNGPGGTAYHLAAATTGSGCTNSPPFAYTPGCGTPDFCAAADHLIAAGLATGKNPTTCVLTGIISAITSNPVNIFARSDDTSRLHAGDSYAQFICAIFTGAFTTGCGMGVSSTNIINVTPGSVGQFPGLNPCGIGPSTCPSGVPLTWWVYTAGFGNVLTFDSSLYFGYDSQFVSGVPGIEPPCSIKAVPSFSPSNYMWLCSPAYDASIEQAEFSPCLTALGDPATGQTHLTVTFANCSGTTQLSAASAAYEAQDIFGQNAFTIPGWTSQEQFAYLNGWQGGVLNKANGFTPPGNFFTMLNAWNPSPPVSGTVRQGYSHGTRSVNPFVGITPSEIGVIGSIWNSPGIGNPDLPSTYLDWMTISTTQIPAGQLSYSPPFGTVAAFRYALRGDIFWHTGQKVTAWDLAFSYIAFKSSGVQPGLAPVTGVKVISPTQVDIDVSTVGPSTKLFLSSPVLPGRDWVNTSICTKSAWDAAANSPNFAAANSALTACIAPSSAVTLSGVITPTASNVDNAKIAPTYDPVAAGNLIGSGPWTCGTGSGIGGPGCSTTGTQATNPGDSWTLTRYGIGTVPGGSINTYFRSAATLAMWVWGRTTGIFSNDFLEFSVIALCFGKPVGTSGCTQWQSGIGASPTGIIGIEQESIVFRFVGVNWVSPYDWRNLPPQNIASLPPVLHEGSVTLNPCSVDPVKGYDC